MEDQFPAGLRVLVVDDDPICLLIVERLLRSCLYQVTICEQAVAALSMLRENKSRFDVVLSDVHMPHMDGFALLEQVRLEMDVPVIMMSANGETSNVMKGISQGACDYLLKPVRLEELQNIWQHVVRKQQMPLKVAKCEPVSKDTQRARTNQEEAVTTLDTAEDGNPSCRNERKRKGFLAEDSTNEEEDSLCTARRQRVVWSVDLHQKFVCAINHLGLEQAVPKRILDLMNVQGLTRENVASHLQKYRLYLKRRSGSMNQRLGMPPCNGPSSSFMNSFDPLSGLPALQYDGFPRHPQLPLREGIISCHMKDPGGRVKYMDHRLSVSMYNEPDIQVHAAVAGSIIDSRSGGAWSSGPVQFASEKNSNLFVQQGPRMSIPSGALWNGRPIASSDLESDSKDELFIRQLESAGRAQLIENDPCLPFDFAER